MSLRFAAARAVSTVSTWGLKHVFHRPAANFPGKVALYVDPQLIGRLRGKLGSGSVVVVGTNGKTTVTNLLADVLERDGRSVVCNRTGANLDSGVSTALLHAGKADWGVFESDELWLAKILPQLRATYVVLLNLFRDQLDRCGEIDRIQESIVGALGSSPETVLVYNADDPLCATIADRVSQLPGREGVRSIAFGVAESMGLAQNLVTDATMCQRCSTMFEYEWRQYGQLGEWRCPNCGFSRPALDFAAKDVRLGADGLAFNLTKPSQGAAERAGQFHIEAPFSGAYMVYNLAAVGVAASLVGCGEQPLQEAISSFDPRNGRLQTYEVGGRRVLLNLAKNPTGFNQNLKIVNQDGGRKAVAFFINDKEADGHDVSWLWDVDFEELAAASGAGAAGGTDAVGDAASSGPDDADGAGAAAAVGADGADGRPGAGGAESGGLVAFAGGLRGLDMKVRLKYAGVDADVVESAEDLLTRLAELPTDVNAYVIANYTALPAVKAALDAAASQGGGAAGVAGAGAAAGGSKGARKPDGAAAVSHGEGAAAEAGSGEAPFAAGASSGAALAAPATLAPASPIVVAHLFPDLLNLYGDGGNVRVLEQRLRWRGIPVEVVRVNHGDSIDLAGVDVVMMGGSPDREQKLASADLLAMRDDLHDYIEQGGPLLAICGSYQILGREWLADGEVVAGLGLVGMTTGRPGTSADRLVNNIVLRSSLADDPVVGYENHAGRTHLDAGVEAFGSVVSQTGLGNNEETKQDGVRYKNLLGTYLHGPLLSKNPGIADWLLARALERHAERTGEPALALAPLDDAAERAANAAMCRKLGVKER